MRNFLTSTGICVPKNNVVENSKALMLGYERALVTTMVSWTRLNITLYNRTSNNGHCRGIQMLSVIGGVR